MTALSTRKVDVASQTLARDVEGEDCVWIIGPIPLGSSAVPNLERAEDDALAKVAGSDAMENMVVREGLTIYVLGIRECFRVTGDVVRVEQPGPSAGAKP
jgi:hypothetical protein